MPERQARNPWIREQGHTYEDYAAIPEEAGRYELLDGELLLLSTPSTVHQMVSTALQKILYACDEEYLVLNAPLDVILSKHSTLQPDIVMVHRNRMDIVTLRGIEGPPDLVVEILSPSTASRDRGKKQDIYAYYGVPELWIVDPANELLEQYFSKNGRFELEQVYLGDDVVQSPRIPCIQFTMSAVMDRIPKTYR
jgi:Uma2 family endonuclease